MLKRSLLIIVVISAAAGCAMTKTVSRPIFDDGYTVVRLEAWLDDSRNPIPLNFDHPAEISEAEMGRVLGAIRIVQPPGFLSKLLLKSRPEAETAFTEAETEAFAKLLTAAFRTAAPNERVVFFLHHQRSVYKGTTTSGVAFVKDKRLNILLGRYLMGNQPGYPDITVGGNPLPDANDQDFFVVAGPFQTLENGKEAPGGREKVFSRRWLSIDFAALSNAPPPPAEPSSEPGRVEPAAPPMSLEEKLKTLNKLKEDGLITEEEYAEKRKELLKSF